MPLFLIFKLKNSEWIEQLQNCEKINIAELLVPIKINCNYPSRCYVRIVRNCYYDLLTDLFKDNIVYLENNKIVFSNNYGYLFSEFPEICDMIDDIENAINLKEEQIESVEGTLISKSTLFKRRIKEEYTMGAFIGKDVVLNFAWFFGNIKISEVMSINLRIGDVFILGGVANGSILGDQGLCVKFSINF